MLPYVSNMLIFCPVLCIGPTLSANSTYALHIISANQEYEFSLFDCSVLEQMLQSFEGKTETGELTSKMTYMAVVNLLLPDAQLSGFSPCLPGILRWAA